VEKQILVKSFLSFDRWREELNLSISVLRKKGEQGVRTSKLILPLVIDDFYNETTWLDLFFQKLHLYFAA